MFRPHAPWDDNGLSSCNSTCKWVDAHAFSFIEHHYLNLDFPYSTHIVMPNFFFFLLLLCNHLPHFFSFFFLFNRMEEATDIRCKKQKKNSWQKKVTFPFFKMLRLKSIFIFSFHILIKLPRILLCASFVITFCKFQFNLIACNSVLKK